MRYDATRNAMRVRERECSETMMGVGRMDGWSGV